MSSKAGSEHHPQPEPNVPGPIPTNVAQNVGNTAVGSDIQQQYHYYNKYIEREIRENDLAQIIKALAQLLLAAGFVIALLTSLIMLLRLISMLSWG